MPSCFSLLEVKGGVEGSMSAFLLNLLNSFTKNCSMITFFFFLYSSGTHNGSHVKTFTALLEYTLSLNTHGGGMTSVCSPQRETHCFISFHQYKRKC